MPILDSILKDSLSSFLTPFKLASEKQPGNSRRTLFYKRGLIRDDLNAYNEDYAYGIDGPHIVEHFKTREEMEAAIRAHRMWPLGFVQIPDGSGGWRDSNLPVFAHAGERMLTTGRPTLVIYGLKAYAEQSQAIERERERFRLYERALEEGAVIEQLEEAEDRSALKGVDFEARILPGTNSVEELFSPLLGALLETRRQFRREAWGITSPGRANGEAAQAISLLESRGIPARERDCLLGVDAYYSTFRFEHRVNGQRRVTRMTHIPSLADIRRTIIASETGREIEALRRTGVAPGGRGVVLLNEVRQINGNFEVGSQLEASRSITVDAVLDQIERLPVVDRARLDRNRFAATRLNLGVVDGNQPQQVFVTIEFPIDTTLIRDRTNLLSGVRERLRYLNGSWLGTVTGRRIMELEYDADGREIASRIWHNAGTLDAPAKGLLLQQTRTVETWATAPATASLDPYLPTITKILFDHVTGQTRRELFGLFPLPIATADDQFVTESRYSPFGILASAATSNNGRNNADWQRPLLEKLVNPILGNSRFSLTNQIPEAALTTLSDLRSNRFTLPVVRRDLLRQTTKSLLLDNTYDGRIIREEFVDAFDGTRSFTVATSPEYRDDFHFGLVPVGSRTESLPGAALLATQKTVSFDPATRQLIADETDYTGKSLRHTWDLRWEAPVVSESTARRTVTTYDRDGRNLAAVTTSRSTGEELARQEFQLAPDGLTWSGTRTFLFRPGITNRVEESTLSSFGKLISNRSADVFEARPVYDADGRQTGVRIQRRGAGGTGFSLVHRVEDDFQWQGGALNFRVQTFLDGQPHDLFRAIMDAEGRTVTNQLKNLPNLALHTAVTFDGDSERPFRAETFQNGRLRLSRVLQAEARQPDGSWQLPVRVVPAWGLPKVEIFTLGEPLGRPALVTLESGDQLRTTVWYDGTAISQTTERYSRSGLPKERVAMQPAGIEAGIPYDVLRVERLTPWGNSSLAETKAMVRGTDITFFSDTGEEKTYFDIADPLNQPAYGIDPHGRHGVTTELSGRPVSNVLTLHTVIADQATGSTPAGNETLMRLAGIDLRGLFSHKISFKTFDAGGNLIDERIARIPNLGDKTYSDVALRQALSVANPTKRFRQRFERGWLIEQPDTQTGGRMLVYTNAPPAAGTRAFAVNESGREFPTEIAGIKASAEELDPLNVPKSFFRTSHFPAVRELNPYMPGVTNVWTSWTTTESKPDGTRSFDSETFYDAQGRLAVSRAAKSTASGRPGSKMVFQLTDLPVGSLKLHNLAAGSQTLPIDLGGQQDFSGSDFLVLRISSINRSQLALTFADAGGTSVMVTNGTPVVASRHVNFWPAQRGATRWLPDSVQPEQGTSVTLSPSVAPGNEPLIISVHDLDRAGLDIRRIVGGSILLSVPSPQTLGVSALQRLNRGVPFISSAMPVVEGLPSFSKLEQLATFRALEREGTSIDALAGLNENFIAKFNGLPFAHGHVQTQGRRHPVVVFSDSSDADAPTPLYAISRRDGRFIEHYAMPSWGDAQVYTVVNGFKIPRYDVFNARNLADENSPGFAAYGYDYSVRLQVARDGLFPALRNRIDANSYRLAGEGALLRLVAPEDTERRRSFDYGELHNASTQAVRIASLPSLAQSLLHARRVPWMNMNPAAAAPLPLNLPALRTNLLGFHVNSFPHSPDKDSGRPAPGTGLLPTSFDPESGNFVNTSAEAELIGLSVALGEDNLARALLQPYMQKSLLGSQPQPLHDSYDGYTRAARTKDPLLARAPASHQNIEAQLSIAEASFIVGLKTGDADVLTLGRNLVLIVLDRFQSTNRMPRGVTTQRALNDWDFLGTRLWPEGAQFSTRWNARACLLFRELDTPAIRAALWPQDTNWTQRIHDAALDSEAWLRANLLPEVTRTGVVPSGIFEIQDVHGKTTALTPERSTSAAGWLDFLLAADAIGIPRESTRHWLDNLARTHGVTISGIWGLDEAIALDRPDVISPALTAHFARVAAVLDHLPAASFARQQLAAQSRPDGWPVAITATTPTVPVNVGNGSWLFPDAARTNWPVSFAVPAELFRPAIQTTAINPVRTATPDDDLDRSWSGMAVTDLAVFVTVTALFYLVILGTAIFWWRFRGLRGKADVSVGTTPMMPEPSMQRAEERWAKRVLGVQTPSGSENTRFSNAPVEHNFLMQLRAIYKLAIEWRRQENDWAEDDIRIAEDESDPWLNGMDEFASIVGIYMRWVIKAGAKDGFERADILTEHEDSNHIWSRLVMFFAEFYWGLLVLVDQFNNAVLHDDKARLHGEITRLLTALGVRERARAFDARVMFNCPANPQAMDLLVIQKPGATLEKVLMDASLKLRIPISHLTGFVEKYKTFKRREQPWPIHPYIIEMAKMLPHFGIMGIGALVWYNQRVGENPIVAYLWELFRQLIGSPTSLIWGLPLIAGTACTILGHIARVYRFTAPMLPRIQNSTMMLDRTITGLFARTHDVMPGLRKGRRWDPNMYDRAAWAFRAVGFTILGITLLRLEPPSFATFLTVKGIFAMIAFAEVGAIVLPLAAGFISKWLQDHSATAPVFRGLLQFIHKLNITATRPASPLWLSIKYHTQPSAPSGDRASTIQTVVFYFVFAAIFAFVGAYLCQEMFPLWFTEKYLTAANWKLVLGGFVFWNTMYLLRYGLFLAFTGLASFAATFPIKALFIMFAAVQVGLVCLDKINGSQWQVSSTISYAVAAIGLVLIWFESPLVSWFRRNRPQSSDAKSAVVGTKMASVTSQTAAGPDQTEIKAPPASNLGVVYMSGDDLSHLKLTPALLMSRWTILRDRLDSSGVELLFGLAGRPDDKTLERWFTRLYESEKKAEVTLWHPCQICVNDEKPVFDSSLGLHIQVESTEAREELITAWHLRRWLVTMMSTAGHAQDTAITLVDIAARLASEGLAADTAFYLVQNKYDNNDNNRPSQTPYDKGELAHRNKLARLLKQLAPGCRAYSIQNWTPFGFKAGGLTGMDLAYEEAMRLTTMLVLDRNANVHDLDALMIDLRTALNDPDVIIVIPGRGTTNTLTPLGQASQMVEEGHRSFLKGLMTWLGGRGSEMVGTGWGNLLACYYGRTQRAMLDPTTPKMPLTSRMRRGSSFAVRVEGLIGFTPHAVGISEDTWAVSQTAHNAMALGRRVKFLLSRAIWHKIRETWSHAEWLASFPRWSGGFLQMMHDPLMQQINDFGPASVFAKEVRSNSGRNFLTAPFALLNILLMPLAIMLDVTPFIEILVVLWNFGFVMNQILTIHGLNVYLEGSGFSRASALVGGGFAGLMLWVFPAGLIFGPAIVLGGFIVGGFVAGLSRWLYCRVRDIILFGPQLVLHTLGQLVRQSLEFSVSGASPEDARGVNMAFRTSAGPREDRPLDTFPTFINLRTIIWVVGLVAILLNVVALSNLDMLNVLLLLPSLLFSVSIFVGPFLMTPKPGKRIGLSIALAKMFGWGATLALLTGLSVMFGRGGWLAGLSVLAMIIVIALLLYRALRFSLVQRGVKAARRRFQTLLTNTGVAQDIAGKLAAQFASDAQGDRAKIEAALRQNAVPVAAHELVMRTILEDTAPALRRPVDILTKSRFAQNRFVSAFARSFLLSYFVLIWFFIVPVPGIFVFTARDYRISLRHEDILTTVFCVVALACAAFWIGRVVNWWKRTGMGAQSLESSVTEAHEQVRRSLASTTPLNDASTSAAFALLTDAQTYVDQQSPAHARNAIESARLHLKRNH